MGATYTAGEVKTRPGVYSRYENRSTGAIAGADDGTVAVVIQSNWGPLGVATVLETSEAIAKTYGNGGTVDVAQKIYAAGAKEIIVVRAGKGGTKGSLSIQDGEGADVVTLATKYEGNRALSVTIREKLSDANAKEFIVYEDGAVKETLTFDKGAAEPASLVEAINEKSNLFNATKTNDGSGTIAAINQTAITAGTNPEITNEDYSNAFAVLEAYKFNIIAVDTNTAAVHLLLHAFIKRVYENGLLCIGVVGEPTSTEFADRCTNAAAFNDEKMVYVGGAYKDADGNSVEGYLAAAVIAGLIAATPSNQSIVHTVVTGAYELVEKLTNSQYERGIKSGMILFSENGEGGVWVDSGVNTLVSPAQNQDDGWKKIKRTKVRFELFDRMDRTIAPVIGKINCDSDGIANVLQLGGSVLTAMAAENKILAGGSIYEDIENPAKGDSAWFIIDVDDIDTLEKIYLNYQLRFSAN